MNEYSFTLQSNIISMKIPNKIVPLQQKNLFMEATKGIKHKILFICLGNICRSPAAEGIMKAFVEKAGLSSDYFIDSAGINGYHDGESADARMMRRAAARGYKLTSISRRIKPLTDYDNFDLVIGMDSGNLRDLNALAPSDEARKKIRLITDYCTKLDATCVPDPYYGDTDGFNRVIDILEDACDGLLKECEKK